MAPCYPCIAQHGLPAGFLAVCCQTKEARKLAVCAKQTLSFANKQALEGKKHQEGPCSKLPGS